MLQRIYGRDVTLITSAEEIAREVAETLARRGVGNDPGREGDYRFLCTGDPAAFRDVAGPVPAAAADRGRAGRPGHAAGGRVSRADGRGPDELRPIEIEPDFIPSASGSALFRIGSTRLICTAMVEESVPPWMRGRGTGWVTSEYGMLPGSTVGAEVARREPRPGRRAHGRDPAPGRPVAALGGRLQGARRAHGVDRLRRHPGRRRHPLRGHLRRLRRAAPGALSGSSTRGALPRVPLRDSVAAVSVGIVDAEPLLDLPYAEDSRAEVDMNVVMTGSGELIEVQATAERTPFGRASLDRLLELAAGGIETIGREQARVLAGGVSGRRIVLASGNAHKAVELARRAARAATVEPYAGELPEETGDDVRRRTRCLKARHVHRAIGGGGVGAGRRLRHRGGGAGRGARRALGPLRRRGRDRRGEPAQAARRAARARDDRRVALRRRAGRDRARRRASCTPAASCAARSPREPRGSGGFGYDPAFVPEGETRTVAEMSADEKDAMSHRARAAAALRPQLPA